MDIYADIILRPTFPNDELERLKGQQIASIEQEKSSPFGLAYRLLPSLLYEDGHAYSTPWSGAGDVISVASITTDDLSNYHNAWFKANNATLIVTGDVTMMELKPLLEEAFSLMPNGQVPTKKIGPAKQIADSVIYLVDRPDSAQSAIIAAKMVPEYGFEQELPLQLMNEVLGASFNARINMNLREDKGWSYGARSAIQGTQSERPFIVRAPVQSDKTAESIAEILKELNSIIDTKPATASELARALDKRTLTLPGRWETASAVESDIAQMVKYDLSEDYWDNYVSGLRNIDLEQINQAAKDYVSPGKMIWLVVGDKSIIEQPLRDLDIAEVIILEDDSDGAE